MSCYSPMIALPSGRTDTGKVAYKITGKFYGVKPRFDEKVIPCGQCIGCRLDKSRTWANRMMMELEYHDSAKFLTLTYDDEHLPLTYYKTDDNGEVDESAVNGTLEPDDLKNFLKRLRRYQEYTFGHGIMYYAVGEYGSETYRPHYHAIIYDLDLPDLEPLKRSPDGKFQYYISEKLQKLWPYGYSMVCNVSWETCAYVARYVMKKQYGQNAQFYEDLNIIPEFSRMSLKPAIGKRYYEDHKKEIYKYDQIHINSAERGIVSKPPAYFDRLYDIEYPSDMERIKHHRERVGNTNTKNMLQSEKYMEYTDLMRNKELFKQEAIKSLKRNI